LQTQSKYVALAVGLTIACAPLTVQAGVYSDDLSRCIVRSSTADDRLMLMKWIFSAISLHPAVQPMTSVTPEQRDLLAQQAAALTSRLLTSDCRAETVAALKYESSAFQGAFELLGRVAMSDLMTEPSVASGVGGASAYMAKDPKLQALVKQQQK
jgi:hypothetical protein